MKPAALDGDSRAEISHPTGVILELRKALEPENAVCDFGYL